MSETFFLRKMSSSQAETVQYSLNGIVLNEALGSDISIRFTGRIQCVNCARDIKKTFFDGHCFPCFQKLASCDMCILKPELCHYHSGTCRDPEWGREHCLIPHVVYLSNTTGLKVGITRKHKRFERWIDQGAIQTVVLAEVPERLVSGKLETLLAKLVGDKSDWRGLILGKSYEVDLLAEARRLRGAVTDELAQYLLPDHEAAETHSFQYPILCYPQKVKPHNFDKDPLLSGKLNGIRGQYIFVGEKAVNIRKYSGYEVEFSAQQSL